MNNAHHYDNRDRSLPPVYDGEVAVTSGEGGRDKGNLIAALSEGAFLNGTRTQRRRRAQWFPTPRSSPTSTAAPIGMA